MAEDRVRKFIARTIEDVEALVYADPGEIFIDIPADTPRYIRVEEGDTIQEGDVLSQTETELDSPTLGKWTIERIGHKKVVGTDQDTGEQVEWQREALEKKLAIGEFSTQLTAFDRVNVTQATKQSTHGGPSAEDAVTVVLYGNDGQQFNQTYRLIEDRPGNGERSVELIEPDRRVETFDSDLRERFDLAVKQALRYEGYGV